MVYREEIELCYYCNKSIVNISANPSEWGLGFCHKEYPGVVKQHHVGCVTQRLKDFEKLKKTHKQQSELLFEGVAFWGWGLDCKDNNSVIFNRIVFNIICSSVFKEAFDAEKVNDDELDNVYIIYKKYKRVGIDAWCSLKRNKLQPLTSYLETYRDFFEIRDKVKEVLDAII